MVVFNAIEPMQQKTVQLLNVNFKGFLTNMNCRDYWKKH